MKNKSIKKSSKKSLNKEELINQISTLQNTIATHAVVLMFLLAGVAIGFSLYRSRGYINPARNENHYNEETAKNVISKIDYKLVEELEDSISDIDVKVDASLSPNRTNPFSE